MNKFVLILLGFIIVSALLVSFYPRGIRNNNPGNIKRTDTVWQGQAPLQTDKTFVQFVHPKYGFRAMTRILRNYQRRDLNSIRQIISTYAPSNENDTEAYIQSVAKRLNVSPDEPINLESKLFDLLLAIAVHENGVIALGVYSEQVINEGVALA